MLDDFIALLYPRNCLACGELLYKHESQICNRCYLGLPRSQYHLQNGNPVERLFYGRVPLVAAAGYYLFSKQSGIQKLLHDIKYKGNHELAVMLGTWYGRDLKLSERYSSVTAIVPVPLHPDKLKQRGYNQSERFAAGLSQVMNIPVHDGLLARQRYTGTQTRKQKFERWENVEEVFCITSPEKIKDQHVLLVDDVITTGATVESCCASLLAVPGIRISVASIAFAVS